MVFRVVSQSGAKVGHTYFCRSFDILLLSIVFHHNFVIFGSRGLIVNVFASGTWSYGRELLDRSQISSGLIVIDGLLFELLSIFRQAVSL